MNNNWPLQSEGYSNPIKFLKTREVKSPSRANKYDAGIDFYVPEFTMSFIKDLGEKNKTQWMGGLKILNLLEDKSFELPPQERVLIPSGIHCQMANFSRALIAANKSGVATKTGLIFGAQVVDYEYQGEIHISLINTSNEPVKISAGMKAIQFLETPIFNSDIIVLEEGKTIGDSILINKESFFQKETTRGADGFGSSDKK